MSKNYKIRWRQSDVDLLVKSLKNYNAKIYRVEKNHPEWKDYQPLKISKKEAINSIKTRTDFNRLIKSLQDYTVRGVEKPHKQKRGGKVTPYQVGELKKKQREENRIRKREREKIENLPVKVGGKDTGKTRAEMGKIKDNELKPHKSDPEKKSEKEMKKALESIDKRLNESYIEEKRKLMRENYLKGLNDNGFLGRFPELEKYIKGISHDKFYEIAMTDDTGTFQFYKDPIGFNERLSYIVDTWKSAYQEEVGMTKEDNATYRSFKRKLNKELNNNQK